MKHLNKTIRILIVLLPILYSCNIAMGYVPEKANTEANPNIPTEADVAEELVKLLCEKYKDTGIKKNVQKSLVKIGRPAVKPLIKQLGSKSADIRIAAAEILGEIGPDAEDTKEAVSALVKSLGDSQPKVLQVAVINAIGKMGSRAKDAVKTLNTKLSDRYGNIRLAAAEALGKIGPASAPAVPALVKTAVGDSEIHVRLAAIKALGEIGPNAKAAVPVLKVIMESYYAKNSDPEERKLSLYADKSLIQTNPADRSPVRRIINDSLKGSGAIQDHATFILVDLGTEVEPELRAALKEQKKDSKAYERIESILKKNEEKSGKKSRPEKSEPKKSRPEKKQSPLPHQVWKGFEVKQKPKR